jgi:hypothetical protein
MFICKCPLVCYHRFLSLSRSSIAWLLNIDDHDSKHGDSDHRVEWLTCQNTKIDVDQVRDEISSPGHHVLFEYMALHLNAVVHRYPPKTSRLNRMPIWTGLTIKATRAAKEWMHQKVNWSCPCVHRSIEVVTIKKETNRYWDAQSLL